MTDSGWSAIGKKEAQPIFTKEMAKNQFEKSKKSSIKSSICAVVYGHDGTGKTGACMDCRTEEEKDKLVIVFDLDDGASPLKEQYWQNDENIVVLSPIEMFDNGDVDYMKTYDKLRALVAYVKTEIPEDSIKAVIVDGLDTLKKWSEWTWKISAGMQPTDRIEDMRDWEHRNWRYNNIIIPLKNMNCDRYFITHLKEIKKFKILPGQTSKTLALDHYEPDWLSGTPGMMWQKILFERIETEDGKIVLRAKLEKSKHDLSREGKTITVAEIDPKTGKSSWRSHALHDLLVG